MLIEHTNRLTEDKSKIHLTWSTKNVLWCVTVVNRMLQLAKSPHSQPTRSVTQPSRQRYNSQPKSQCCAVNGQRKTTTVRSQRSQVKVNIQPQFLCQKMWTAEIEVLGEFRVKLTKCWPKSTLVKSVLKILEQIRNPSCCFSHVWVKRSLQVWDRTDQM